MDLRQFFSTRCWWGKLFGALFGFLMAGPAGALLGILIGNLFDKGLSEYFASSFWYYRSEKNSEVRRIFFTALFSVMGHMAKADGRVSQQSIQIAKTCMREMRLNNQQKKSAQVLFQTGKHRHFNLSLMLAQVFAVIYHQPHLLKLFIDTQYHVMQADGLSENKLYIMNQILSSFNFAPLQSQHRFSEDFIDYTTRQEPHTQSYSAHSSYQDNTYRAPPSHPLNDAYTFLEIPTTATKQEVKRAYRRLMSRHHPDKLMAKGLPAASIQAANATTQKVRKAYEQICAHKGW